MCRRCLRQQRKIVPSRDLDAQIKHGVLTEEERDALMEKRLEKAVEERKRGLRKHYKTRHSSSWAGIKQQITHLYDRTRGVARSGKESGDGRALWGEEAMQFVSEIKRLYGNARAMGTRKEEVRDWTDLMDDGLRLRREELMRGWAWDYDCPLMRRE